MRYMKLGKTGYEVSVMGIGGIPIQRVGQEVAEEVIATALEHGVNFLDTARGYTDSEEKFGLALEGVRDRFILATKTPTRDGEGARRDLETSLRMLRTDSIELYQLHNVSTKADLERVLAPGGALEAVLRAQEEGLVEHIGITGHNDQILLQAVETGLFATVQAPVNAVERQFIPVLQAAKERNMGTIAMKPLAGGSFMHPELALRQLLAEPLLDVIIPGVDSAEQMRQNAELASNWRPLNDEERPLLEQEVAELGKGFCRRCEYCLPCPQGIKIPQVFILEGYATRYNLAEWAVGRYAAMDRDASECAECGICESRCPYSLPIREMLRRAHGNLKS
ncbi:MAG TPA: aldo/keto reductase [Firmicutes bacterium]|nr:aldo/keto reductase [Bacillota bacterium]